MDETPFRQKLAELANVDASAIRDDLVINPPEWDSILVLDLIAAIDESFGVTVPFQSLQSCATVGDIRSLIEAQRVARTS